MKKNFFVIVSFLLIMLLFIFFCFYNKFFFEEESSKKYSVILHKCVDGDTAWFNHDGDIKKYRFLAIDSPELKDENGKMTADFTCELLKSAQSIIIEYDNVGKTIDKYNRNLVWVYIDDDLLQEKLLEKGFAQIKYIYANYKYLDKLYQIESIAIDRRLGIWNNYDYKVNSNYYTVIFDYTYLNKNIEVLKNSRVELLDNPYKKGCRFIGWKNGNYLFDLSTKINKNYNLKPEFDC